MASHVTIKADFDYHGARVFYDQLIAFRNKYSKGDDKFDQRELTEAKDFLISQHIIDEDYKLNSSILNRFLDNFKVTLVDVESKPYISYRRTNPKTHIPCIEVVKRGIELFYDNEGSSDVAAVSVHESILTPNECEEVQDWH